MVNVTLMIMNGKCTIVPEDNDKFCLTKKHCYGYTMSLGQQWSTGLCTFSWVHLLRPELLVSFQ